MLAKYDETNGTAENWKDHGEAAQFCKENYPQEIKGKRRKRNKWQGRKREDHGEAARFCKGS